MLGQLHQARSRNGGGSGFPVVVALEARLVHLAIRCGNRRGVIYICGDWENIGEGDGVLRKI